MRSKLTKLEEITDQRRERMIRDIINAEHDLLALSEAHRLKPDVLAKWIEQPENQQCLLGLCQLADVQTQVLLSRYRMLAAGRLIRLATNEDGSVKDDVARRACVDLLRVDMKRATVDPAGETLEQVEDDQALSAMRAMFYGGGESGDDGGPSSPGLVDAVADCSDEGGAAADDEALS